MCLRIESVSGSTAGYSYASVASNCVVTTLRLETLVQIYLALVDIFTSVSNGIKDESNFAVTAKSSG